MKQNILIFSYLLLSTEILFAQNPVDNSLAELQKFNQRYLRPELDAMDTIFLNKIDKVIAEKDSVVKNIAYELNDPVNMYFETMQNALNFRLLKMGTDNADSLFLSKYHSYDLFCEVQEKYNKVIDFDKARDRIAVFLIFSDFLNDKEYYNEEHINSAISEINSRVNFFNYSQKDFYSIIKILLENTYNENKKKNLEAFLIRIKK